MLLSPTCDRPPTLVSIAIFRAGRLWSWQAHQHRRSALAFGWPFLVHPFRACVRSFPRWVPLFRSRLFLHLLPPLGFFRTTPLWCCEFAQIAKNGPVHRLPVSLFPVSLVCVPLFACILWQTAYSPSPPPSTDLAWYRWAHTAPLFLCVFFPLWIDRRPLACAFGIRAVALCASSLFSPLPCRCRDGWAFFVAKEGKKEMRADENPNLFCGLDREQALFFFAPVRLGRGAHIYALDLFCCVWPRYTCNDTTE